MKEGYEGLYVALGIVAVVVLIMVIIKPLTFGVVILLLEIGLESDLGELLRASLRSAVVALVGIACPFALGYGLAIWWGKPTLVAVFLSADLTATSSVLEDHFEPAVAAVVVSSASALGESVLDYVRWIADSRQTC